jgi:hypothetical protein
MMPPGRYFLYIFLVALLSSSCTFAFSSRGLLPPNDLVPLQNPSDTSQETIHLELAIEQELLTRCEPPISTLTWFHGDHHKMAKCLRERSRNILLANPWLSGRMTHNCLEYNRITAPTDDDSTVQHLRESPISDRSTPLDQLYKHAHSYTELNEHEGPLWRITLVSGRDQQQFALIFCISHMVADSHVFYHLYNMLLGSSPIVALDMAAVESSDEKARDLLGKKAWEFQNSSVQLVKGALGMVDKLLFQRPTTALWMEVDPNEIENIKRKQSSASVLVSTNDILTSWFFQTTGCQVGLMCTNYRGKLQGHHTNLGRNYWGAYVYAPKDYASPIQLRQSRGRPSQLPSAWNFLSNGSMAIASSWTMFSDQEDIHPKFKPQAHVPLFDFATYCPSNFCVMRTFSIKNGRTGVYLAGDARLLNDVDVPFLSKIERL